MADTIKEFLVGLGFKVDKTQQTDFVNAIDKATKAAEGLGLSVAGAATAVAAAVYKMASDFDQLYWRTQRLGSSAVDIKAFGYAISQLGGSAQGAQQALTAMSNFIRYNPGGANFLTMWGVDPKHLGDSVQSLEDLGKSLAKLPDWQQKVVADIVEIDTDTLLAMGRGVSQYTEEYQEMANKVGEIWGVNFNNIADDSNKFMTDLRKMKAEFELNFYAGISKLLPIITNLLQKFVGWIERGATDRSFERFANNIVKIVNALGSLIDKIDDFARVAKIVAGAAAGGFAGSIFGPLGAIAGMLLGGAGGALSAFTGGDDKPVNASGPMSPMPAQLPTYSQTGQNSGVPTNVGNLRNPNGRGFRQFGSVQEGVIAMARQLVTYQQRDKLNTLRQIISKYAPSNENDTQGYINFVSRQTGINANQQVNLSNTGTLEQIMHAMIRMEHGRALVSHQNLSQILGNNAALVNRPYGGIQQSTHININGSSDPRTTAQYVAQEQNAVNQRMVGSFQRFAF